MSYKIFSSLLLFPTYFQILPLPLSSSILSLRGPTKTLESAHGKTVLTEDKTSKRYDLLHLGTSQLIPFCFSSAPLLWSLFIYPHKNTTLQKLNTEAAPPRQRYFMAHQAFFQHVWFKVSGGFLPESSRSAKWVGPPPPPVPDTAGRRRPDSESQTT